MWSVTIECTFFVIDLDKGIDGSTILLLKDDIDEFMAVVPKSGQRLILNYQRGANENSKCSKLCRKVKKQGWLMQRKHHFKI